MEESWRKEDIMLIIGIGVVLYYGITFFKRAIYDYYATVIR